MHSPLLSLKGLCFAYPGAPTPVFDKLCAELPAGVALVCGDESRGKSTLLRLLAGQIQTTQGTIEWAGQSLKRAQVAWFDPADPAREQQVVQAILAELVSPEKLRGSGLLQELGLEAHLGKPLYQLSTGSRRKVFLAAALAQDAPLTLLDQPFMALDQPSVDALLRRFAAWQGCAEQLLLIADYLPPAGLALSGTLDLDGLR